MKIFIFSPGKSKNYLGEDIVLEFTSRLTHYTSIEWKFISPSDISTESESILKAIPENSFTVLLDEKGKTLSSVAFSEFLNSRLTESVKNLVFIIGGAYGVDESLRAKADFTWSLSSLVFPHELVRSIVAEQLYRGFSILKGEKYHHQ